MDDCRSGRDDHDGGPPPARYANHFEIGHNAFEFLLDFGQTSPESARAPVHTRIVVSPVSAKVLLGLLRRSTEAYEQSFGAIHGE